MPALTGAFVRLDPLRPDDVPDLVAAAAQDRSSYAYTTVPADLAAMTAYVDAALHEAATGAALPLVVRTTAGQVIGSTRFLDLGYWRADGDEALTHTPSVAEIGHTWFAASAQRTAANTQTKVLMLDHAFTAWRSYRVCLKTDARNARSRAAIERLGAAFEGVRRAHARAADGGVRDTAYYSILAAEWPSARERLTQPRA